MIMQSQLLLLFILIVLSAFFAMSEVALIAISRFKVRHMVEKRRYGSEFIQKLKEQPEVLLSTILIGNNLVNTAAAALTTYISLQIFKSNALGIATGIATLLILFFGDITPKSIAANNSELIAPLVAPIIWYISVAMYPLIFVINLILKTINKMIGLKKMALVTKEELKTIVKASEEEGSIKEIEKRLVHRIFDIENTSVSDVMTPKKLMVSVNSDMLIKEVLNLPARKLYSRFPVYDKSKENIVGIFYLKDMLKHVKEGQLDIMIKDIMRKPFFVFEHKKLDAMLRLFQTKKVHMAIVINDKAEVVGVVTIENILEEIVGEIIDESDRLDPSVTVLSKNEWLVKGSTEIEELNSKTGIGIKDDYVDLDSFINSNLSRSPKQNEIINYEKFKIVLEDVQGKKVIRARIVKG